MSGDRLAGIDSDDALDRLHDGIPPAHAALNRNEYARLMVDLATVRSALEQLREERDAAEEWLGNETRRRQAAEAELERLRRHPDAWSQEAFDKQKARAEAAEAEVQRLREERGQS